MDMHDEPLAHCVYDRCADTVQTAGNLVASEIRASGKRYSPIVPIVAMTADAFINEQGGSLSDFNGYILKPVKPDELYAKLVAIFDK